MPEFEPKNAQYWRNQCLMIDGICDILHSRIDELEHAIRLTLDENGHLADGDNCTLAKLKSVVTYDESD